VTLVVVGVHADDAVYSVGEWIAERRGHDVVVVTMLGGVPRGTNEETWVKQLLADNERACSLLGARTIDLDFLDGKYGKPPHIGELTAALRRTLRALNPTEILVPLGVRHADHLITAPAAQLETMAMGVRVCVYEDLPYRVMYPDEAVARMDDLTVIEFTGGSGHRAEKQEACRLYSNQFGEDAERCCFAYERIWVVRS
jgi:LmbE family N-acetylglucosaminyl deacetylase